MRADDKEGKCRSLYAWVPSIYLLTTAVSAPIHGKLADLFGRKRVLYAGIGVFLLGSVLSGAARIIVVSSSPSWSGWALA